MKKKISKKLFALFAVAAVCVPLAACSGSGTGGSDTTTAETESSHVSENTESASGATEASAETTASGEGSTESASADTQTTSSTEISGHTPLDNASVKSADLQIDIEGYQIYPAGVGGAANSPKPVVVFYYDVTNLGDKETDALSAWTELFDAYQNTGDNDRNILGQGVFVDESISADQGKTVLKKGDKISYYKSYELTDDTTSVTLRSHDGLGGAALCDDIIVRVQS